MNTPDTSAVAQINELLRRVVSQFEISGHKNSLGPCRSRISIRFLSALISICWCTYVMTANSVRSASHIFHSSAL